MNDRPGPQPSLLVIAREDLFGRAVETVLAPAGYRVSRTQTADQAINVARRDPPDAVLLHVDLLRTEAAALCGRLRDLPELGRRTPLVVAATDPLSPAERREALRAGAWHVAEAPFNAEDLLLRLNVFVEAKREADRFRDAAFWDAHQGMYTPQGIQHRAVEMAALAARAHEPLACVVLSPELSADAWDAVVSAVSRALRELGRRSDAIGSLGNGLFVVVAPATPAERAARLAVRLAGGVKDDVRPHLRAGYDVAAAVDRPEPAASRLIDHARQAALEAARNGADQWLREYRGG